MRMLEALFGLCLLFHGLSAETESTWLLPDGSPIVLVQLEPASFSMGSAKDEPGRIPDEGPQHRVVLSDPFWIGKHEVTQEQFQSLMGYNPAHFSSEPQTLPVEQVSWQMAVEFCSRLTQWARDNGQLPEGYQFSLPTEAQWEYACAAGTETRFSSGDTVESLSKAAWHGKNSAGRTHPVGSLKPNNWGLHDMHGNVWEWCLDWKGRYPSGTATDPAGPHQGLFRVIRGGCWYLGPEVARTSNRSAAPPEARWYNVGFRVALVRMPR